MQTDPWNPAQYGRFHDERLLPFTDLIALVQARPGMRVIDLGCGTGEITAALAERLPRAIVEGVDSSASMLEQALPRTHARLSFRRADILEVETFAGYDLVFSHAALQWVPDNEALLRHILERMQSGAQIAVQVPKNDGHASHRLAATLAGEPPFAGLLDGYVRESAALNLERYAELLHAHGFRRQTCFEKIYGHELASTNEVVEWVKGTLLTAYTSRLGGETAERFIATYRRRLLAALGDQAPYFYPFRRLLFWAEKDR